MKMKARLFAHYLPQFHPIRENNEWWGPGFTEWTNVAKAKPLFSGHVQPKVPADLGFYDLRLPEVREQQASLAQKYGIEGFIYWHYWFGDGKRLLERPFSEVVSSGRPDFPFCLAWANVSWSGIWHGCPDRVLIEQTYPGINDIDEHFYSLLDAFLDERYIKVNEKNLFGIFSSRRLLDSKMFAERWQELARRELAPEFHFFAIENSSNPSLDEFYASYTFNTPCPFSNLQQCLPQSEDGPNVFSYGEYVENIMPKLFSEQPCERFIPCVTPNWDNTPRTDRRGYVYFGSTPDLYKKHLQDAVNFVRNKDFEERLVFIKSWNEWGEGNYLEPDLIYGHEYLAATLAAVS